MDRRKDRQTSKNRVISKTIRKKQADRRLLWASECLRGHFYTDLMPQLSHSRLRNKWEAKHVEVFSVDIISRNEGENRKME